MAEVVVIDSGGRGNALAHLYARSPSVDHVYVMPGNAGSSLLEKCEQVYITEIGKMIEFIKDNDIDLVDVGPEGYLTRGLVDECHKVGIKRVLGQVRDAGILETSKCWAKDFWKRHNILTPEYKNFSDSDEAKDYINEFYKENPGENVVVKAGGICGGKGSIVCNNLEQALYAVDRIMVNREFDDVERGIAAGKQIVVEKRMYGHEIMFFVATDGRGGIILPIGTAMDFKRAFDPGDVWIGKYFDGNNPNTGGLISISPSPFEEQFKDRIMNEIAIPTLKKFQEETGHEYLGIGYFGVMLSQEDGKLVPRIEEFNRRWGDPELEAVGPRIKTDYYTIADRIVERRLHEIKNIEFDPSLCYALVALSGTLTIERGSWDNPKIKIYRGYPKEHLTNQPIRGLREVDPNVIIYHNGTAFRRDDQNNPKSSHPERKDEDGNIHTTGGRVLTLVAKSDNLQDAKKIAEENMSKIFFRGIRYRKNISEEETLIRSSDTKRL